jgi:hypothetical protein
MPSLGVGWFILSLLRQTVKNGAILILQVQSSAETLLLRFYLPYFAPQTILALRLGEPCEGCNDNRRNRDLWLRNNE